ncbi:MAG: hypothetical protein COV55_01375 [Candidatus Komeilibacteria bacterium CG11_big_fil_rev_8_21_14_0_20_36_20]|uniref:Uncharacterized protein n=1 Tax=Candidatus Komeilibacteria bacterium CG11_big_fil_rev_8_21_14_0_20_36_20 TaxID=1974477 RepID=A0A2H0NDT7_9BACT|nr:MAG: hypothetical protein COV55_01375 [Candidatus Komeilibacteria bacterium CG11_big_fil_rev_8_21_14_0_20_36_20]PIR81431.1 MAG: hypothetical protein COU21_04345 [Candidatus Komeilibacteria bacterium CG10_big_fil_rev_8_21_14_0_10_36_65]PJC55157.1 MAG: hypothetical protein CO027_03300 [Candidatus Komeilibacteria bacterium CG_4_9_14_0_2_um_filter_36_13]
MFTNPNHGRDLLNQDSSQNNDQQLEVDNLVGNDFQSKKTNDTNSVPVKDGEIHIMPKKFLIGQPTNSKRNIKKMIIGGVIFIVFIGGVIGFGVWYINKNVEDNQLNINNTNINQNSNQNNNENSNQNNNSNQNINGNENANANDNENQNNNSNQNNNENSNQNNNSNQNINGNENANDNENQNESVIDSDQDGLTTEEEIIYSSNPRRDDTDRDGYKDGMEVQNLYSPIAPNDLLADSGLVTQYSNNVFGYSIFRPTIWISQAADEKTSQILFLPDSESGEFISVEVVENNKQELPLSEWQQAFAPGEFENYSLGGQAALRSVDGFEVLMAVNQRIYRIVYTINELSGVHFATTFEMMLNSFNLLEQ